MIDAQAAQEVVKQGIWIDRAVLALIFGNLGTIGTFIVLIRKQKRNEASKADDPKPGDAESCKKHAERLMAVETKQAGWEKNWDEWRKENREDHRRLFEKLDEK